MFLGSSGSNISYWGIKKKSRELNIRHVIRTRVANEVNMAGSSAWLSVIVKHGQQIVKDRTIFQCAWEDTFGSLLLKFGSKLEAETINQVVIVKNEKYLDPCHKVPVDAPVSLCDQFGCLFIYLYLSEMQTTGLVVVREALTCISPIEAQYYSSVLIHFPPICYYCGLSEENLVDDDEIKELLDCYATVFPICFVCKSDGKSPFCMLPSNVSKRAKKS